MADETKFPKKVRTTMRPDREIEVDAVEYETLRRRGYLYEGTAKTDEGAVRAVERAQAKAGAENKEG
jgi:hypothetical protein